MPSLSLRAPTRPSVSVLAYDGMSVFEMGIVTEVFGLPRPELDVDWYRLTICGERPGPVPIVGGATIQAAGGLDDFASARTVIVPGVSDVRADCSPDVVAALRLARQRGARVVSLCSGAFALAAAGCSTADGPPRTGSTPPCWHSAAGLDLCLHLVRKDFGPTVANAVARRLVVAPHREGGQAQFIEAPVVGDSEDDRVVRSMQWAMANLASPITVATLARHATMSTRTYLRHHPYSKASSRRSTSARSPSTPRQACHTSSVAPDAV